MIRHSLWLISAFTVAAAAAFAPVEAVAKKNGHQEQSQAQIKEENPNIKHCHLDAPPPKRKWGWKTARLTAQFIKTTDGHYRTELLGEAENLDEKLPMASITKFMTAAIILDEIDKGRLNPDQMIDVSPESYCLNDNNFATIYLQTGLKQIPVTNALTHLLKLSSNTMALNLARAAGGGSLEKFIAMMNAKALSWDMKDTHFINPHGLPEGDRKSEYTTAKDMLKMAEHLLPYFNKMKQYSTAPLGFLRIKENKNPPPLRQELYKLGAIFKTGTIDECDSLMVLAEKGDHRIVDIQLCGNRQTRFQNAIKSVKIAAKKLEDMMMGQANAAPVSSHPTRTSTP